MTIRALMYHDVITAEQIDMSGFPGPASAMYKLTPEQFEKHLNVLSANLPQPPKIISNETIHEDSPFFLTFDDGGVSAYNFVLERLETLGWKAHFFITTDRINKNGFLSSEQIIEIDKLGHCIGTHSKSHPDLSKLSKEEVYDQWHSSSLNLSDILGKNVNVGGVPGGWFNNTVAQEAARANIEYLFTSTPTTSVNYEGNCAIIGRFGLKSSTPINTLKNLITSKSSWRKQKLIWDLKKILQKACGPQYKALLNIYLKVKKQQ